MRLRNGNGSGCSRQSRPSALGMHNIVKVGPQVGPRNRRHGAGWRFVTATLNSCLWADWISSPMCRVLSCPSTHTDRVCAILSLVFIPTACQLNMVRGRPRHHHVVPSHVRGSDGRMHARRTGLLLTCLTRNGRGRAAVAVPVLALQAHQRPCPPPAICRRLRLSALEPIAGSRRPLGSRFCGSRCWRGGGELRSAAPWSN